MGPGIDQGRGLQPPERRFAVFLEDLELPDLAKRQLTGEERDQPRRAGFRASGPPSALSIPRTMRKSLSRRIALGRPRKEEIKRLQARLRELGAVDYASMLALPLRLLRAEPPALRVLQDAYRFVMLDEAQDTCHTQHALLRLIVERHHNLMIVGDPQQCVFSWRGADPKILLDFPQTYPGARVIVLNENHRSTGVIVALANAVAAPLQYRPDSWTQNPAGPRARVYGAANEADEARFVAAEIGRLLRSGELAHPGQAAVLFRTNPQARALALALRAEGIPFRVRADADLFGRPEVRDLVAYLRLAHSPTDGPALARIINTPPRRLRLVEQALRRRPVAAADLPRWAQKRGGPPARRAVETLLLSWTSCTRMRGAAVPCACWS